MSGYFLISRRLNDPFHDLHPHATGEPACSVFAWIDLIGMARWKDTNGVPRGSIAVSERFLATRWNWHRSRVTRFLDELVAAERISRGPQVGRKPGHIRICNYDAYQDQRTISEPQVGPREGPREGPKKKEVKQEKKRERRSRLTDEWLPSDSHRQRAARDGIDIEAEVESFRNHHGAKGSLMVDWDKAFFTWLGNAKRFAAERTKNGKPRPYSVIPGTTARIEL